mgnify:FL=1|jgi:hypothetical protein
MIPVNQFILGSSDPLLYPSEKMTNSIDEQIAFLQSQNKQLMKLIVVMLFLMQIMVQLKISKL